MAYVIYWSRAVVMDVLLFYNLAGIMEKNTVPFPLSPAELIGDVLTNWQCAIANIKLPYIYQ
jgi:hypothetical protein